MESTIYTGPQVTSDYWPPDYIGIKDGRLDIVSGRKLPMPGFIIFDNGPDSVCSGAIFS